MIHYLRSCLRVNWSSLLQKTCHHNWPAEDVRPRWLFVKRTDMKGNGPKCTTKRWWVYSRWGAFCVDVDSRFFR